MLKAHSIDQEYWLLRRTQCKCGALLRASDRVQQSLRHSPIGPVDEITVRCWSCGALTKLEFDISSFFGYTTPESRRMDDVVNFLRELAANRDFPAIEYIDGAVDHFMAEARRSASSP